MALPEITLVPSIHNPRLYDGIGLPMWVLYDHPTDMPDYYVLRLWDAMITKATPFVFRAVDLETMLDEITEGGGRWFRMEPFANDDPKIMGTFI